MSIRIDPKDVMDVAAAAEFLGCSIGHVRTLIQQRRIRAKLLGRAYVVSGASVRKEALAAAERAVEAAGRTMIQCPSCQGLFNRRDYTRTHRWQCPERFTGELTPCSKCGREFHAGIPLHRHESKCRKAKLDDAMKDAAKLLGLSSS